MLNILILLICVSILSPIKAYQGQSLEPIKLEQRLIAPKQKSYPVLEKLEQVLYPAQNFNREAPGQRLDRLEIAVFGKRQEGDIATRLDKIQNEIMAWQISNVPSKTNQSKLPVNNPVPLYKPVQPRYIQKPRSNYSYMGDRVMSSVIQTLTRRGINALF